MRIIGTIEVAPLYEFDTPVGSSRFAVHTLRLLGGRDLSPRNAEIERRINAFSYRTGLSLRQIQLVKVAPSGELWPQWNGNTDQHGFLRTSGNPGLDRARIC